MPIGGWSVRPAPGGVLTSVTVETGGTVVTQASWGRFWKKTCNISAARATGAGTCDQLDVSACDEVNGVALDIVLGDCTKVCACAKMASGGMVLEEM